MTIEDAKKVGRLLTRLNELDAAIYKVERLQKDMRNCELTSVSVNTGNLDTICNIPRGIVKDLIDMLDTRLRDERTKVQAEITEM